MKLYFKNSYDEERVIAEIDSKDKVMQEINKFVNECNDKRTDGNEFKIYYIRTWGDLNKDGIWYDVSSHTEFFILREN